MVIFVLMHAGKISHIEVEKTEDEYNEYKTRTLDEISKVEVDFIKSIEKVEKDIRKLK